MLTSSANPGPFSNESLALDGALCSYRQHAKRFYLDALAGRYPCPNCGGRFSFSGPSQAACRCGHSFDPTLLFQRSPCCDSPLAKKRLHYVCGSCGRVVASRFLFDERLSDRAYFRERMREARDRKRREALLRRVTMASRSGTLILTDDLDLNALPGLETELDLLCDLSSSQPDPWQPEEPVSFDEYRRHVSRYLEETVLFTRIAPLILEERRDRALRFIVLVFMEQDRTVDLHQLDNDILISRP